MSYLQRLKVGKVPEVKVPLPAHQNILSYLTTDQETASVPEGAKLYRLKKKLADEDKLAACRKKKFTRFEGQKKIKQPVQSQYLTKVSKGYYEATLGNSWKYRSAASLQKAFPDPADQDYNKAIRKTFEDYPTGRKNLTYYACLMNLDISEAPITGLPLDTFVGLLATVNQLEEYKIDAGLVYHGVYGSVFALHVDPSHIPSAMIHLDGAPKYWCVSPWSERDKLNALMQKLGACCIDEISHVRAFLDPELVAAHGIQVSTCVQGPDTIMVLEPGTVHWGFNLGVNTTYHLSLATSKWGRHLLDGKVFGPSCEDIADDNLPLSPATLDAIKDAIEQEEAHLKARLARRRYRQDNTGTARAEREAGKRWRDRMNAEDREGFLKYQREKKRRSRKQLKARLNEEGKKHMQESVDASKKRKKAKRQGGRATADAQHKKKTMPRTRVSKKSALH